MSTYTVTVKGREVTFKSAFNSDGEALDYLDARELGGNLSSFAVDLKSKARTRGLSSMQWAWVHKLATDAKAKVERSEGLDVDLLPVVEIMALAAEAQKRLPKIVLTTSATGPVVLKRAGSRSSREGTINVTDGGDFGSNAWYGRVELDGSFTAGRDLTVPIRELLTELAADPAKVAGQNGVATGACCFCAKLLSTRESRSVGYGPVCAEKFGLPWGDTAAADEEDERARRWQEKLDAAPVQRLPPVDTTHEPS